MSSSGPHALRSRVAIRLLLLCVAAAFTLTLTAVDRAAAFSQDYNNDGQARMCVSGSTPMSEGRTFPTGAADTLYGVVNNTTYDSGCAV